MGVLTKWFSFRIFLKQAINGQITGNMVVDLFLGLNSIKVPAFRQGGDRQFEFFCYAASET